MLTSLVIRFNLGIRNSVGKLYSIFLQILKDKKPPANHDMPPNKGLMEHCTQQIFS